MARASAPPWIQLPAVALLCCSYTFAERKESSRDGFPQEFSHFNGPDLFRVDSLLVIHDTVFRDVGGDLLCFRERTNPLIIIELLQGWVLFFFQEHELRVEEEPTFFWQITNRPRNREGIETSKQTPPLSGSCERDGCVQMFLTFICGARSTHGRQFDVRERRDTCFTAHLFSRGASRFSVPATARGCCEWCSFVIATPSRKIWNMSNTHRTHTQLRQEKNERHHLLNHGYVPANQESNLFASVRHDAHHALHNALVGRVDDVILATCLVVIVNVTQ